MTHRRDKRLAARLGYARLRHQAVVEDIDYRSPRGLARIIQRGAIRPHDDSSGGVVFCGVEDAGIGV